MFTYDLKQQGRSFEAVRAAHSVTWFEWVLRELLVDEHLEAARKRVELPDTWVQAGQTHPDAGSVVQGIQRANLPATIRKPPAGPPYSL